MSGHDGTAAIEHAQKSLASLYQGNMNKETETAPDVKLSRRDANTVEQLKAAVASGEVSTRSALGQECVRDLTEEEKLAHKACNQFVPEKAPDPKQKIRHFSSEHTTPGEKPHEVYVGPDKEIWGKL